MTCAILGDMLVGLNVLSLYSSYCSISLELPFFSSSCSIYFSFLNFRLKIMLLCMDNTNDLFKVQFRLSVCISFPDILCIWTLNVYSNTHLVHSRQIFGHKQVFHTNNYSKIFHVFTNKVFTALMDKYNNRKTSSNLDLS